MVFFLRENTQDLRRCKNRMWGDARRKSTHLGFTEDTLCIENDTRRRGVC